MRTTVPASGARIVRTTAAATAVGFAYSLFLCAYFDPAAIGWTLTPFIGAFWGALLGGLVGTGLRLVGMALTGSSRRQLPVWAVGTAVALSAVSISLVLAQYGAIQDSFIDTGVSRAALLGAALLPMVLTALAYFHLSHTRTHQPSSPTLEHPEAAAPRKEEQDDAPR